MRLSKFTVIFLLVFAAQSQAQWTKNLSLTTSYDDNAFRNYTGLSDYATQILAYVARDNSGDNWHSRLFYRGYVNLFTEYNDRNYHAHQLGFAWSRSLNEAGNALNLGVNGSLRANGDLYNYYDYREASGYGNVKFNLDPASSTNLGYKIRGRWYSNLPELSYAEHYLFARLTHVFESRTTLMLEGNYGLKIYREQTIVASTSGTNVGHYGRHSGGMGHLSGNGDNMGDSTSSQARVSQLEGKVRLSQSLTGSTGLSVEGSLSRNPVDGVRYLAGQVSGYTTEDELFDDRYGYETEEFSTTLTQLLPLEMQFRTGLVTAWKDYVNRPALDLNGEALPSGELRNDRQLVAWFSLDKSFNKIVTAFAEFYWIDNQSNDQYYDYKVSLISGGLSVQF